MEETVINAANPVVNYVFGAFCLILLGLLVYGVRAWLHDKKETTDQLVGLNAKSAEAIANSAASTDKLSTSIDASTEASRKMFEELCRRPCILEDPE